ncbi:MAG: alanine--tRNA ligase-related protein, partial [Tomitella sp.]|nr:alanine--tRNA ligase-related protein [Tomitella sp.]
YPALETDFQRIQNVAVGEEAAFLRTLSSGSKLFEDVAAQTRTSGSSRIGGSDAFTLHDTYGFPIDLTLEMAAEAGLEVDETGFRELMTEQRQRAKADAQARKHAHADLTVYRELLDKNPTEFTGFDELNTESTVLALVRDGVRVPAASAGEKVEVILDRSPLYAESGGQIADAGVITADDTRLVIDDVQKIAKKLWVHKVTVERGQVTEGDSVLAQVDGGWRSGATQGHSGTHMVHAALRQVLGPNAVQAGSLNKPGYLRFDFHWQGGLAGDTRQQIEDVSNEAVAADFDVNTIETSLPKAKEMGALALFGENYGDEVRVVEIGGPFSMELCGGTHVGHSSQIGPITVLGESSVGSGVRRIEAFVGMDSMRYLARERSLLQGVATLLKVPSDDVPGKIENLLDRLKTAEREVDKAKSASLSTSAGPLADSAERVGGVLLVASKAPAGVKGNDLRSLAGDVRGRLGDAAAVVVLFGDVDGSVPFVVATSPASRDAGLRAGDLVKAFAPAISGRGGGKPDLAQGSGTAPDGIPAAVAALKAELADR